MSMADLALAAALPFEGKKDCARQVQSGDWKLTLTVSSVDMPVAVITAPPGTRYQVVVVPIDDDETPIVSTAAADCPAQERNGDNHRLDRPSTTEPAHRRRLTPAQQAGMLCKDPSFQAWLVHRFEAHGIRLPLSDGPFDDPAPDWAANVVRRHCGVASRSELNTNGKAAAKWRALIADYPHGESPYAE